MSRTILGWARGQGSRGEHRHHADVSRGSPAANRRRESLLTLIEGKTIPWRGGLLYEYHWERTFTMTGSPKRKAVGAAEQHASESLPLRN